MKELEEGPESVALGELAVALAVEALGGQVVVLGVEALEGPAEVEAKEEVVVLEVRTL